MAAADSNSPVKSCRVLAVAHGWSRVQDDPAGHHLPRPHQHPQHHSDQLAQGDLFHQQHHESENVEIFEGERRHFFIPKTQNPKELFLGRVRAAIYRG